jgi:hypothetical protein
MLSARLLTAVLSFTFAVSTVRGADAATVAEESGAETSTGAEISDQVLELPEVVVEGDRPFTAASSRTVRSRDFSLRPMRRPADLLEVAPGLIVMQHAGGGKANQYYLRGFDADHGTDVALKFDGVPINNPTHGHGQGYADLNFVIPEVLRLIEVDKGPYFVEHGDFATAGAVNLATNRLAPRNMTSFQAGRFGIYRGLVMGGGELTEGLDGMIAGEVYGQDGPFENPEDYARYSLFTRLAHEEGGWTSDLTFISYRGTWNASGQLPRRAVNDGTVDRFGSLDPTEGGTSQRHQLYGRTRWQPDAQNEAQILAYGVYYDLDLFSNFTFFARDPVNGDQIEQKDKRWYGGLDASYAHRETFGAIEAEGRAGVGLRADRIANQLNYTRERELLEKVVADRTYEVNSFFYLETDVAWTAWLRSVVGFRFDDFYVDVSDRFTDRAPALLGEGTENEVAISPKASLVFTPFVDPDAFLHATNVFLNYGEGFHSNDARGVVRDLDPADLIAKARGGEVGIRTRLFDRLDAALAFWMLDLDSELVFVGDEGTTEASGRTRRLGIELEVRYQLLEWLFFDVDYTHTHARFRDEPDDADFVPLAPEWTVAGDLSVQRNDWYGSLRMRSISARPANEDDTLTAAGYTIWDLQFGRVFQLPSDWTSGAIKSVALEIDIQNLFNQNYREAQFATDSRLQNEPETVADINYVPGYPITVIGGIRVEF